MEEIKSTIEYKGKIYPVVFTLNVMEDIQAEYGSMTAWSDLTVLYAQKGMEEPDVKALKFGLTTMINEGIDMENEENETDRPFVTTKQVGRMLTEIGLSKTASILANTVSNSVSTDEEEESPKEQTTQKTKK